MNYSGSISAHGTWKPQLCVTYDRDTQVKSTVGGRSSENKVGNLQMSWLDMPPLGINEDRYNKVRSVGAVDAKKQIDGRI